MKKIKIIFCSIGLLYMFNCDSRLEEIAPEDSLSEAVIFSNFSTIEATTVGIYNNYQDGDFIGGSTEFIGDFLSDDVVFVGSFTTLQDIRDFDANATNGTVGGIWFDIFDQVRDANNILVNLPPVQAENVNFSNSSDAANFDTLKQQFLGEAYFGRALANFIGVNIFAQPYQINNGATPGLPLVIDFFNGDISPFQLPRSTVNETHALIESDLLMAAANLPETNGIRADRASAKGLLSRLYLYREQWTDAANMANDVINSPGLLLAPDLTFYNAPSSEHVFQVINLPDDSAFGSNFDTFYNPTSNNGRGDLILNDDLIAAYTAEPGDLRYTALTYDDTDAGNQPARFTAKYPNGQADDSDPNVIRMAEMHLTRAEANLRGGTNIGATPLEDVNAVRERAGLSALTSVTLDDILLERRKELAFEGHRRMDLLRNGMNLRPAGTALSAPGGPKTILPIPEAELNNNPNAEQNASY